MTSLRPTTDINVLKVNNVVVVATKKDTSQLMRCLPISGVVTTYKKLTRAQIEAIRAEFELRHKGPSPKQTMSMGAR